MRTPEAPLPVGSENALASPSVLRDDMLVTLRFADAVMKEAPLAARSEEQSAQLAGLIGLELDRAYRIAGLILGNGADARRPRPTPWSMPGSAAASCAIRHGSGRGSIGSWSMSAAITFAGAPGCVSSSQ